MQSAASSQQSAVSDEPILDLGPEFNQTLQHEHADGKTCEACSPAAESTAEFTAEDFARPTPKVIEDHNAKAAATARDDDDFLLHRLWTKAVGVGNYKKRNGTSLNHTSVVCERILKTKLANC